MKKRYGLGCILLVGLAVVGWACGFLFVGIFAEVLMNEPPATGHFISEFVPNGDALYFGAGQRLYRLNTLDNSLDQIVCREGWLFGRPAVTEAGVVVQLEQNFRGTEIIGLVNPQTSSFTWEVTGTQGIVRNSDETFAVSGRAVVGYWGKSEMAGLESYDLTTGRLLWKTEPDELPLIPGAIFENDRLWYRVQTAGDSSDEISTQLASVDLETGEVDLLLGRSDRILEELLWVDEQWLILLERREGQARYFAVRRNQPDVVAWENDWKASVDSGAWGVMREGDYLIMATGGGVSALRINDGTSAWHVDEKSAVSGKAVHPDKIFLFEGQGPAVAREVWAVDVVSGEVIWKRPENIWTTFLIYQGRVYVNDLLAVEVWNLQTGDLIVRIPVDSAYQYYEDD